MCYSIATECSFRSFASFRRLALKQQKNYETPDLRFRKLKKIEKLNYEARHKAVTCMDR